MSTTDSSSGTVLGDRYRLLRPLGAGASATVYLAEDLSLRRQVAVKVLRDGLTDDDGFLRRFRAEAVAVAGLNHPNILSAFDWGEADGRAWLVTEYLPGGSLRDLLDARGGTLWPDQVASIGAQAADGLAYAHARGFVHRDVKPANLLFDDAGRVRIADFGVARALAEATWTEPSGGLIGTVRYTSPEQARGLAVDGRADVYALALVLYECLTGEVPFAADSQAATLQARIGAHLPPDPLLGPLAGVLDLAASPDRATRLDASTLASMLTEFSQVLTAQPKGRRTGAAAGLAAATAQQLGIGQHVGGNGHVAADDLTEVGGVVVGDETLVSPVFTRHRAIARRRFSRWPFVLAAVVLCCGIAAGAIEAKNTLLTPTFSVPNLVGSSVAMAKTTLSHHHATLSVTGSRSSKTVPAGDVLAQFPVAQKVVKNGSQVRVTVSLGPPPVAVPSVVGLSCEGAVRALDDVGFKASCPVVLATYSSVEAEGFAIAVFHGNTADPTTVGWGSALQVQLSKGPAPISVPSVVNDPVAEAMSALRNAGFVPTEAKEFSTTVAAGTVIETTPVARAALQPGSTVSVVVSLGYPVVVPVLGHVSLSRAEVIMLDAGLVPVAHGSATAQEWTSEPAAGTTVAKGSAVELFAQ